MKRNPMKVVGPVVLIEAKGEPRIDSRLIAKQLHNQHKAVMVLIERYADRFRSFGHMTFEMSGGERKQGGGTALRYALLNEDQAFFLLSLSRNTDRVVDLKAKLVQAFREARQAKQHDGVEYLPTYRALHDLIHEKAGQSSNERFVHLNMNRLVNKTVGIRSGQRDTLPMPAKSLVIVAQAVAAAAVARAADHHEGYRHAKEALGRLSDALQALPCSAAVAIAG